MQKPKLLDLFCGVGGAGEGYELAGYEVTGVDNVAQPNNPHHFILADALEYLIEFGHLYDVVHASPPCQEYSNSSAPMRKKGKTYPKLIEPIRNQLLKLGKPYVIENVMSAPIRRDLVLVGTMFGLKLLKRRKFEVGNGLFLMQPIIGKTNKTVKNGDFTQVVGKGQLAVSRGEKFIHDQGSILKNWAFASGIDWAKTYKEFANSIPPAYTQYIGENIYNQIMTTPCYK